MRFPAALLLGAVLLLSVSCTTEYRDGDYAVDQYEDEGIDLYERYDPELVDAVGMFAELDYYGAWYQRYPWGYVWRPTVVLEWRPYLYGEWMWTDYGWTWISYEPFGWAVYHYGFWAYDFGLGWIWIPDYEWWPNRAMWYYTDDYIAWAPMAPEERPFDDPWASPGSVDPWVVVPRAQFFAPDVGRHRLSRDRSQRLPWSRARHEEPDITRARAWSSLALQPVKLSFTETIVNDVPFYKMELPVVEQHRIDMIRTQLGNPAVNPPVDVGTPETQPPRGPKKQTPRDTDDDKNEKKTQRDKKKPAKKGGKDVKKKKERP